MKACVFHGPRDVRVEEVEMPKAGRGEVVLRVLRCAVCGTDKRIYMYGQKNVRPPAITGHEIVGRVHEIGAGVNGLKKGRKVLLASVVGCGKCIYCKRGQLNLCDTFTAIGYEHAGGFAEYVKVPARAVAQGNIIPIPEAMNPDYAALIEPLSCCLNGQEYLCPQKGERALVFGAGPIGLMHAAILKSKGCRPVCVADVSPERLDFVRKLKLGTPILTGNDAVSDILKATNGEMFDIIVTACSDKRAQENALKLARKKARISFFAGVPKDDPILALDANLVHYREISIFGAFASNLRHMKQAAEMIMKGALPAAKFVTQKFRLDEIHKAYETIESGRGIKIVIDCESER